MRYLLILLLIPKLAMAVPPSQICLDYANNPQPLPEYFNLRTGQIPVCTPHLSDLGEPLPTDGTYHMTCWLYVDGKEHAILSGVGPGRFFSVTAPAEYLQRERPWIRDINMQCGAYVNEVSFLRGPIAFEAEHPAMFPQGAPGKPIYVPAPQ